MSFNGGENFQICKKMAKDHGADDAFISSGEKVFSTEDLLHEILLHLPTKSLLRLQCISKLWASLISNPSFRRLHSRRLTSATSSPSAVFLVGECSKSPTYLSRTENLHQSAKLNPLDMETTLLHRVVPGCFFRHSCNGLVCVVRPVDKLYNVSCIWCHVYNPSTQQYASIPRPDIKISGYLSAINLAFDPSKSDQFKIIGIWEDMVEFTFYIYSSKTGSWKNTGIFLDARYYSYNFGDYGESQYFFRNGVFLNGNLHWASSTKPFLCFDTDTERFRPMPSTPVPSEGRNIRYFGESAGFLHLIEDRDHRTIFNVLEMRGDYSEWYLKNRVDVGFVIKMYPRAIDECGYLNILSLLWERDEQRKKKMKLLLTVPGKIISCDVGEETVSEVLDLEPERSYYKWYHAYKHFESLTEISVPRK